MAVKFGTRGNISYVREISKVTMTKQPNFATIKTTFLDLGKQCADLKAEFSEAHLKSQDSKTNKANVTNLADRTAKFIPAFNAFMTNKEQGNAIDQYEERDYRYLITYIYQSGFAMTTVYILDKTIEGMEG